MPSPTFVGVGTPNYATTNVNVLLPDDYLPGDVCFLAVERSIDEYTAMLTAGWVKMVPDGDAPFAPGTQLEIFYNIDPTVLTPNVRVGAAPFRYAQTIAYRNVDRTKAPFNPATGVVNTATTNPATSTYAATAVDNLVIGVFSNNQNTNSQIVTGVTSAALGSVAMRASSNASQASGGGGLTFADGIENVGPTTSRFTLANAVAATFSYFVFELIYSEAPPPVASRRVMVIS